MSISHHSEKCLLKLDKPTCLKMHLCQILNETSGKTNGSSEMALPHLSLLL